ncbi:protein UPSTREAM OF FLC isoform X1 [Helianthus annuus]|uniref:protein UPSTREAM OF FLC isoform X1 n=1 Tax=Helianthus annuus TaxID=4232 RepID=UPI000B8F0B43|nr:protein UPSTREAM OF FLC isoform X1 [Helianthus annuus]
MEEPVFAMERSFKRRLMEAQTTVVNGNVGCDVGGQMRKVHVVYFLCHNGRIEEPHLFRVHHHSRNGVHLRDVKRWLVELRGKDMPESFAWSYKRRYKEGYVWQDLLNDDLITPICDNEYVLKGSEISSTTLNNDIDSYKGEEVFELKTSPPFEGNTKDPKYPSTRKEYFIDFSTNTSIENEESSFGSNVSTEDTTKNQDANKDKEVIQIQDDENENKSFHETLLNDNTNDNNNNNNTNKSKKGGDTSETCCFKPPQAPTYSFRKSGRTSRMFRNWITCGNANTHEKAVVRINKRNGIVSSVSEMNGKEYNMGQICKEQKSRGFEKRFDANDGSKKSKKEDSNSVKSFGAGYKPISGPNCSQCGRQFNPEKLHNHMKYCRGMKAMAKSTNSRLKPKTTRSHSPSSVPMDTFFLTNN